MKQLNLLFILFIAALAFQACKKDDESKPTPTTTIQPTPKKAYEKRWEVSDPTKRLADGDLRNMIAIEFAYNTYIIFFSDGEVYSGNYREISSSTLELEKYGTLTINTLNERTFGFTLKVDNEDFSITSAAATVMSSSSKTEALCNTWKIVKTTPSDLMEPDEECYVTFSAYGTYLVKILLNGELEDISTNTWMWSDSDETSFCYGDWDGQNISSCDDLGTVSVQLLENNSKCIIVEKVFDEIGTYELVVQ